MARVDRFEDLIAWQKARRLTQEVFRLSGEPAFASDRALRDQIRRASVSIMSNIAEGFERARRREFHQYLSTAKASCAEVRSHLYVALDAGHLKREAFSCTLALAEEVGRILGGLRASVATDHSAIAAPPLGSQD